MFHETNSLVACSTSNKQLCCLFHQQQTSNKQLCCLFHNQQATLLLVPPATNSCFPVACSTNSNSLVACSTSNKQLCCLFHQQQTAKQLCCLFHKQQHSLLLVPQAAHAAWQSLAGLCGSYAEAMRKPSGAASLPVPGPAGQEGLGLACVGHPPFCNKMASLAGSLHLEPELINSL